MERTSYALVTGAGSGLGAELAKQLSRLGYPVVLAGRTAEKLHRVADEITTGPVLAIEADVSSASAVDVLFDQANTWAVRPTLVISCAGEGVFGDIGSFSNGDIERAFSGSLIGTILVSQRAFLEMEKKGGTIVNILSTAAMVGRPKEALYAAAKWGARGFTEALRAESQGTEIKVIGVFPGGIKTPFWTEETNIMRKDTSVFMNPEDLAEVICDAIKDREKLYVLDIVVNRL